MEKHNITQSSGVAVKMAIEQLSKKKLSTIPVTYTVGSKKMWAVLVSKWIYVWAE